MICGAKTRSGGKCQKHGMLNGKCRIHGGLSPKGRDHWNFQNKGCSKAERKRAVELNAQIKLLQTLVINFGLI